MNRRQREATFLLGFGLCVVIFHDMRIDKRTFEVLVLWHVVGQYVEVDNHQTDSLTNLRGCQSDSLRLCQCFKHVSYQLLQVGIVGRDILRHLSQHRLTISVNR